MSLFNPTHRLEFLLGSLGQFWQVQTRKHRGQKSDEHRKDTVEQRDAGRGRQEHMDMKIGATGEEVGGCLARGGAGRRGGREREGAFGVGYAGWQIGSAWCNGECRLGHLNLKATLSTVPGTGYICDFASCSEKAEICKESADIHDSQNIPFLLCRCRQVC